MLLIAGGASTVLGYLILNFISTPGSKFNRRVPQVRFKWVQLFPSIKIFVRGRIIHLHHWFYLSILLVFSVVSPTAFLDSALTRGFLLGAVIQGLKFRDRGLVHKNS
jgi:hypothetical protein